MKLPTPLEAATRVDEGHAIASGLGLDEVAALLRSMARASSEEVREALARAIDFICTSGFITPDQAFKLRAEFNEKCVPSILASSSTKIAGGVRETLAAKFLKHDLGRAEGAMPKTRKAFWLEISDVALTALSPQAQAGDDSIKNCRECTIEACAKIAEQHSAGIAENIRALLKNA